MAPRFNDGRRNDHAVEGTRREDTDTTGHISKDYSNNGVVRGPVNGQSSKQQGKLDLLEDAGPIDVPARDREVPTARRRDTKKSKIHEKGLEENKGPVILDV